MSLPGRRDVATLAALWVLALAAIPALANSLPPSTWVELKNLPDQSRSALFALAVDPANNQTLVAGNSQGSILRSADGGSTWTSVHVGKSAFTTIVFSPYNPGLVLAGTRGAGALVSTDDGVTWSAGSGLAGRAVRVFGFSLAVVFAGTDRGVFQSQDGSDWSPSGLAGQSIDALAVAAIHAPVRILAGSDGPLPAGRVPFYQSVDGGATWTAATPAVSGSYVVTLAAGPLPPTGNTRPVVVGTNAGLFASTDNGASFAPLSGGDALPSTDYTQIDFITNHFDRFYVASDGGGSGAGGLWRTNNAGRSFISLAPPMPSVSALAVSKDETPTLYVATFRPSDHVAQLWVYHDTGGTPQGSTVSPTPAASGARNNSEPGSGSVLGFLTLAQLPYVALGVGALAIVLFAVIAHLRGGRR